MQPYRLGDVQLTMRIGEKKILFSVPKNDPGSRTEILRQTLTVKMNRKYKLTLFITSSVSVEETPVLLAVEGNGRDMVKSLFEDWERNSP